MFKNKSILLKYNKVFIYKGELEYLSKSILDYPNIETGGNLFGYWTHTGRPVIQYVIGPGQKANHERSFFNQDNNFLVQVGTKLIKEHALQHIGEWHSHHQLGLASPSGHDSSTIIKGMRSAKLNKFLLLIGNCDATTSTINPFLYLEGESQYVAPEWVVLEGESPIRKEFDSRYAELNYVPRTKTASIANINIIAMETMHQEESNTSDTMLPEWLKKKEAHSELKTVMDFFNKECSTVELKIGKGNVSVHLQKNDHTILIVLPPLFPKEIPQTYLIENGSKILIPYTKEDWEMKSDKFADNLIKFYKKQTHKFY